MSRSYKGVFVKKHRVYSVEDLMTLYSVTTNTVSNWVREGLVPSDHHKPNLFQGAAVDHFHKQRMARLHIHLRPGEFKCTKCKAAVFPEIDTIHDVPRPPGKHMYTADCPACSAQVWKISSETDRDIVEDCRNPNTSRDRLHEEDSRDPGGIWINEEIDPLDLRLENDRVIYRWLNYAGRYDVKTVDRHLAAIRYCENVLVGKAFNRLTIEDASKVRDDLKRRSIADASDHLSSSSIRHIASHLTAFVNWLLKQEGFQRLPKDLPDYFKLPRAVMAAALPAKPKQYPTISEAEAMLHAMPSKSLLDQRAQAIFAVAFLGAMRADALISLRIQDVDVPNRRIVQDGRFVRSKNGKSLNICWFPIPKLFETALIEWLAVLKSRGFRGSDALFPSAEWLMHRKGLWQQDRQPVPVMSTTHAVTEAFAVACRDSDSDYTPHAAKHTIAAERDARPLTQQQRKAWSANMGHESERITEKHYGKLSDDDRAEVLESIGKSGPAALQGLTDDTRLAIFDGILENLGMR